MKKILTLTACLSLVYSGFSQTHNEQVTVIAPYQPTVLDAYKINVNPQTVDSTLKTRRTRYDILSRKVLTSYTIDNIKPARVAGEPLSKLSPLYVRGGFGNYKTVYGELFYGSGRSAHEQYGAHLKHYSSQGKFLHHNAPFDNSINSAELYRDYYGKKITILGDFYYDRKRFTAYGMQSDDETNYRTKRVYNNVGGSVQLFDNQTIENTLGYNAKLAIHGFLPDEDATSEVTASLDGGIHHTFDFRHPIFKQTIVGIDAFAGMYNYKSSGFLRTLENPIPPDKNSNLFKIHPYGKLRFSGHDFSLGFRVNLFDEQDNSEVQFVPTLRARFNLIDKLFAVEFGMDGNAEYLTYRKMTEQNPFVIPYAPIFLTLFSEKSLSNSFAAQLHREYYLGLNTALSKTIDFSMKGKIVEYKNLLNFDISRTYEGALSSVTISSPYLIPIYQDISCFQIQADLNYHLDEKISVSMMARTSVYDADILYKPKYEANLMARYNIQNKIILKTQFYLATEIYYNSLKSNELKMEEFEPVIDWSLSAEYRFNKRWAAFLELNNILNRVHYDWYNYRSYRMQFLVGATFNLMES